MSKSGPKRTPPAKYCFAQQYDNSCHVMPFLNLEVLKRMREKSEQQSGALLDVKTTDQWYTKREWLAQTFLWTSTWDQTMARLTLNQGPFAQLQQQQREQGIINGHIYYPSGKRVDRTRNPLLNKERMSCIPYNFTDTETLPREYRALHAMEASKTLPIFFNNGIALCYLPETGNYEPLEETEERGDWDIALGVAPESSMVKGSEAYRYYKLSESQKSFLNLPKKTYIFRIRYSVLGYELGFKHRYLPEDAEQHSYYAAGLYQLMMLAMGVDRDNNIIDETHPLYEAHRELKTAIDATPNNPWALESFRKENMLEYHITNLIKNDPDLKNRMKHTVNIFLKSWKYYNKLDNWFNEKGESLSDKKQWLLGEDQYLAYCYVQSARFLWVSCVSRKALNAVLEIDGILATLLRLPFAPGPNQIIRNAKSRHHGDSFLSVWNDIRQRILLDDSIPKEFASFSSHGTVISFHDDLFQQQLNTGLDHPNTMGRLGFTIIDSYYGDQLSPLYRTTGDNVPTAESTCNLAELMGIETSILNLEDEDSDEEIDFKSGNQHQIRQAYRLRKNANSSNTASSSSSHSHTDLSSSSDSQKPKHRR